MTKERVTHKHSRSNPISSTSRLVKCEHPSSRYLLLSSFVSLVLSLLIMLCRNPCTILGRGGEKKSGSGRPIFFSHSSRRQRVAVLSSVRLEQGLIGRQGLVVRRSHSELGQRQRLRLVNGLSYCGEKLQMNHRLYAPS